jgi:hypothetical protein
MSVALVMLFVAAPWTQAQVKLGDKGKGQATVQWDLKRLNQEPFKLVKTTPDPERGQVSFVVELVRMPTVAEQLYDWAQGDGPVIFRFKDRDGVVIRSVKAKLEGEVIPKVGCRLRLLLQMPEERITSLTQSIIAE